MTDHIEHMKVEAELLSKNVKKLKAFIDSDKFSSVDSLNQDLMIAQSSAMATYLGVLKIRFILANSK